MLSIIAANPLPYILAFLIGLATAWWMWAGQADPAGEDESGDELAEGPPVQAVNPAEAPPGPEPEKPHPEKAAADPFAPMPGHERHPPVYRPAEGHAAAAAAIAAAAAATPAANSPPKSDSKPDPKPAKAPLKPKPAAKSAL